MRASRMRSQWSAWTWGHERPGRLVDVDRYKRSLRWPEEVGKWLGCLERVDEEPPGGVPGFDAGPGQASERDPLGHLA
jgi:hypothetical protein